MLAGQLSPPWMVLRIISAIMDKPTERYLADSELGGFPERVMGEIDESLKAISRLDLDAGPGAGRVAAAQVELITHQTFDLEECIELTRDHGWGLRIVGQKKALANVVEVRLKDAEKLATAALPMQSSGFGRRRAPQLDRAGPKADGSDELTFAHEISSASVWRLLGHARQGDREAGRGDRPLWTTSWLTCNGDVPTGIANAHLQVAAVIGLLRDKAANWCAGAPPPPLPETIHAEPPPGAADHPSRWCALAAKRRS